MMVRKLFDTLFIVGVFNLANIIIGMTGLNPFLMNVLLLGVVYTYDTITRIDLED